MIYTVVEYLATILENVIFFVYLIKTLSFKNISIWKKYIVTAFFFSIQCCVTVIMNYLYSFEGVLVIVNILVLFTFCRIMLQHAIWHQLIVLLIAFALLFTINIGVTTVTGVIMQSTFTSVLSMRNLTRIFLLFITKGMLCLILYLFSCLFQKKKNYNQYNPMCYDDSYFFHYIFNWCYFGKVGD